MVFNQQTLVSSQVLQILDLQGALRTQNQTQMSSVKLDQDYQATLHSFKNLTYLISQKVKLFNHLDLMLGNLLLDLH